MINVFMGHHRAPILPDLRKNLVAKSGERSVGSGSNWPPRNKSALAGVAMAAAVAVTAGFVVGGQGNGQTLSSSPPGAERSPDAASQGNARMEFAVFNTSPTDDDGNLFRADVGSPDVEFNLADARRLDISVAEVWAVPALERGQPATCIKARSAVARGVVVGTCAPLATARTSGLWLTTVPAPGEARAGTVEAVGLVPNDTETVTFIAANGTRSTVQPSDNAVAQTFKQRPAGVEVVTASGGLVRTRF